MKNFWIQKDYRIASWHGDVTARLGAPDTLLSLVHDIYDAAAQTRLLIPVGVDLSAAVDRRWKSERTVDLFRMIRNVRVEAELAWYSPSNQVVEGRVADLGELLASLQPAPNAISPYNRELGEPPVAVTGAQLVYSGEVPVRSDSYPETFTVALYSDVWFPYVVGFAHPAADHERFFDNRELANRNASRLNTLLRTISRLVTGVGGRWYFDENDRDAAYAPWLSPEGICLDGPSPALMPASFIDVDWPTIDD